MGRITYTAIDRGRMLSGHSALTEYTFELGVKAFTPSSTIHKKVHKSLDMSREIVVRHGKEHFAEVRTVNIFDPTIIAQMYEFEDSVDGGQTFTFDPYGTLASPSELYTATLESMVKPTRQGRMETWSFSFRIKYDPSEVVII